MEPGQGTTCTDPTRQDHPAYASIPTSTTAASPITSDRGKRSSSQSSNHSTQRIVKHDSLVTLRLSDSPRQLVLNTNTESVSGRIPIQRSLPANSSSRRSTDGLSTLSRTSSETRLEDELMSPVTTLYDSKVCLQDELDGARDSVEDDTKTIGDATGGHDSDDEEVDWEQLQKTEDAESGDVESEDSTAMLLARLEQANNELATNPKSVKVQRPTVMPQQSSRKPRPPSMAQLREMIQGRKLAAPLRFSMLPPPPMTDLEFYAALVKDYKQTAARLPILSANKIRKGIPPPLRGVVWQSMAGARDSSLEDQFERFAGESSPYEGLISKDLGRSFPGVDMFRDPNGDGQRMLGRVLKCYSLYDQKIGYCQGLALLVGPLLMHMTDKQAFCVLIKLMEDYDLRASFTPDLHGLHVKIYQFQELLKANLPALSGHLDALQVDPAYVSQWFLSFFAVTCPLPMLFRIYDVVFAEGAVETIMRVALSLMRKNQGRILACTEMEDILQLLLSRGLWDCYHYNADEFVDDFVSLSNLVTGERLAVLEQGYDRESQLAAPPTHTNANVNAARASEVNNAASRFLGRLWANSTTSLKGTINSSNSNLSPGTASHPLSIIRRTTSKQSLASTLNSMEASSLSVTSSASSVLTEATTVSRDSATADATVPGKPTVRGNNSDKKNLHIQIEDLLVALSDSQRQHALVVDQLQTEREEREEDNEAVRLLLEDLRKEASRGTVTTTGSGDIDETIKATESADNNHSGKVAAARLSELLGKMAGRFADAASKRRSSPMAQTKTQMREEVSRAKEHLRMEMANSQDANRRAIDSEEENKVLKEQLRESHAHVRNLHTEKQRLERQIHGLRASLSASASHDGGTPGGWLSRPPSNKSTGSGLREFKLGRSASTPSHMILSKRTSSLPMAEPTTTTTTAAAAKDMHLPPAPARNETESLLLELVQAKTAEAVAKQEAEEAKQKLEQLRKAVDVGPANALPTPGQALPGSVLGVLKGFMSAGGDANVAAPAEKSAAPAVTPAKAPAPAPTPTPTPAPAPAPASTGGGFWGWGRK